MVLYPVVEHFVRYLAKLLCLVGLDDVELLHNVVELAAEARTHALKMVRSPFVPVLKH